MKDLLNTSDKIYYVKLPLLGNLTYYSVENICSVDSCDFTGSVWDMMF